VIGGSSKRLLFFDLVACGHLKDPSSLYSNKMEALICTPGTCEVATLLGRCWLGEGEKERDERLLLHNVGATTLRALVIMSWLLVTEAEHRQRLERQQVQVLQSNRAY
jgi:hypothetical protein